MTIEPKIQLSEESRSQLIELCQLIERNNPNELSLNMSKGISGYLRNHCEVSPRQAAWLCRNADYQKIPRPSELVGIVVEKKSKPPIRENPSQSCNSSSSTDREEEAKILLRMEKLLQEILDK